MRAGIALYLAVGLASADRLLEATVREAAMSSPEWWEAHHQLAKLQPGTSWFGPIGRAIARDIAKRYGRTCAPGDAVVLGSGFSKTPYWLARTGAFRRVYGIDSSISAVRAMSRYAKALDHGGRGWDIVRYVRADLTRPGQFRRDASLVLDEGVGEAEAEQRDGGAAPGGAPGSAASEAAAVCAANRAARGQAAR